VNVTITGTNDAPVVTTAIAAQFTDEDASFSYTIPTGTFADIDQGDVLSYTATLADGSALPSWLMFDAATQTFSGTPGNGEVGSYAVTVTATDASGLAASSSFSIDVANVNDAPVVSMAVADQSTLEDAPFSFTIPAGTFTDADFIHGDSLSYAVTMADGSVLPSWLSFDAATQTFSGTPTNPDVGTLNVRVTATDLAGASVATTFALEVVNVNDAPVTTDDMAAVQEDLGITATGNVLANDSDVDQGTVLQVANAGVFAGQFGQLTLNADGSYTYVLDNASLGVQSLAEGQVVTETFAYAASDGITSTPSTLTVTITGTNDAPVVVADIADVQEDLNVTATGNVLANDSDVDQGTVLQVANAGVFAGQFGQLTLNADGSYTYVLDNASLGVQSLAEGQVVIETFAYAATDGITSTPSTLTVTITGTNDAPVVVSDTADVQEDLNVTAIGNVLANDSDVDQGTVLQVANAGVFAGQFGQLTLNADGSYTYVLDNASLGVQSLAEGQVVTETFAYAASDGITSTPSTLTVTITGTNDAPVVVAEIADQHTSEDEPFSYTVPAGSFADIDQGDALTYHAAMTDGSALPDWLKFDAATLTFSGTPSNWDVAMLDIAVTAIDKLGATATSAFQLDVQNVNDAPIVVTHLTDQHLDKGKRFSFTVPADTFDDWDIIHGDSLSYTATLANGEELPKWLTFDAVTRTFSGKATGSYNQDILLTVTDEAGASVSQVFSMGKDFHDQDDHCEHGDRGRNDHEDEDQCHHRDTSQDEIFTSSTVKDIIHTGNGADTIVYQRGDGQDTVYGGIGTDNTIVLAGGISKADIALSRQGNDLILETGLSTGTGQAADQITLRNWYDASANNKSVLNLALVTEAIAEFECGSRYRNEHERNETRIDQFDFTSVVNAFDQACSASTTFQHWNATQSLMTAHLHENEDDALGSSAFEEVNIATLLGLGSNAANQNALNTNQLNLQSQLNRHVAGV
jgi:VCBS repeat-containing protein